MIVVRKSLPVIQLPETPPEMVLDESRSLQERRNGHFRHKVRVVKGGPGSGFHGHAGRPGEVGGSAPVHTYIGAKPLKYYMDKVESYPWKTEEIWEYGEKAGSYRYRNVPYEGNPDYSVEIGLENESRNCQRKYKMSFDKYVKKSEDEFQKQLATSDVYMRITPGNLEEALKEGTFENTFTSKKTGAGLKENKLTMKAYQQHRKDGEQTSLGVPKDAPPEDRPIYGYWSQQGGLTEQFDTWVGQYGSVAIKFKKDKIADSVTFTDSDSLDLRDRLRSSDWRHPSILSSFGITNGTYVPAIAKRGPNDAMYWEAQIFDKSVSNIEHVYSHTPLPTTLTTLLDERGIPWSIE